MQSKKKTKMEKRIQFKKMKKKYKLKRKNL